MLANALSQAFAQAPVTLPAVFAGAALLLIYQGASTYTSLANCPACAANVRGHATAASAAWIMFCVVTGNSAGSTITRHLSTLAGSAWLAPLPWAAAARGRAIRLAAAAYGTALATALAALSWAAAHALGLDYAPALAAAGAAAFSAAMAAATSRAMATPPPSRQTEQTASGKPWLLDPIDRVRPAHASRWAMAGRGRAIAGAWIVALLILAPSAAAAALAQHELIVALIVATLGAHILFIAALRCHPLSSAALRATPLPFAHAAAALCRAPLALSLSLLALAVLIPCAATPAAWPLLPAALAGVLLLNALYASAAMSRPSSPRQAALLHGAGLYAVAYEAASSGLPYGALTLCAVCLIAALLARQARRRYRAFHG